MQIMIHRGLLLSCLALLTACGTPETRPTEPLGVPQKLPVEVYLDSAVSSDVYQIVPERSRAEILVQRGGRLARLGHDHVISAREITGYALLDAEQPLASRADLAIDLNALVVDAPELRLVYQLYTEPSEADIRGTSANMFTHVLDTEAWPQVFVHVGALETTEGVTQCEVTLTLKGVTRTFPASVIVHQDDDLLRVRGSFDLDQTDYGIEPFSVLGGAISIRDRVEITYRLEAAKLQ